MKVTDLEDSTRVKEAGIEGEYDLVWALNAYGEWYITTTGNISNEEEYYPAYSLEELLGMVTGDYWWHYSRKEEAYEFRVMRRGFFSTSDIKDAVVEALLWQKEKE